MDPRTLSGLKPHVGARDRTRLLAVALDFMTLAVDDVIDRVRQSRG
jgi:hypothetical protein